MVRLNVPTSIRRSPEATGQSEETPMSEAMRVDVCGRQFQFRRKTLTRGRRGHKASIGLCQTKCRQRLCRR